MLWSLACSFPPRFQLPEDGGTLKRTLLFLALATFGTALPAAAGPVHVKLTGVGGASQGGVYVAPYDLSINGGKSIEVICDDFDHEVTIGESWKATIQNLSSALKDGLTGTRFGDKDAQEYEEAAWLYTQFLGDRSEAGNINFAIWALFTPSAEKSSGFTTKGSDSALDWLNDSTNWYKDGAKGVDFADFEIITPTELWSKSSPQEYLYYCPPPSTPTPEPSSLFLLGTGLLGLGAFARRRLGLGSSRVS